jgi:hypothetical protein
LPFGGDGDERGQTHEKNNVVLHAHLPLGDTRDGNGEFRQRWANEGVA